MGRHIFVYGTLKRGECREFCWPCSPLAIHNAFILATLYDLGPYPAILDGKDKVLGEVWTMPADGWAETLAALDAIEGFENRPTDLFVRRQTIAHLLDSDEKLQAYVYFYGNPTKIAKQGRLIPGEDGYSLWRRRQS